MVLETKMAEMMQPKQDLKNTFKGVLNSFRYRISKEKNGYPVDFTPDAIATCARVKPYTMTSSERINGVCEAIKYIVRNNIPGSVVECGVWRGGSMMAAALTLKSAADLTRDLYLFDTFEGMPQPTEVDVNYGGLGAKFMFDAKAFLSRGKGEKAAAYSTWSNVPVNEVKRNMNSTGYPAEKIHFVKGRVEETVPTQAPNQIALLRLDTDWYESTKHELKHLYPRIVQNGVLIIDDYGHWKGSCKAVDEYIHENKLKVFLNRVDYSARLVIKP